MALTPDLELKYRSLKHHIQWKDLIGLHPFGRQESHQEAFRCSILSQNHLELFSLPKKPYHASRKSPGITTISWCRNSYSSAVEF